MSSGRRAGPNLPFSTAPLGRLEKGEEKAWRSPSSEVKSIKVLFVQTIYPISFSSAWPGCLQPSTPLNPPVSNSMQTPGSSWNTYGRGEKTKGVLLELHFTSGCTKPLDLALLELEVGNNWRPALAAAVLTWYCCRVLWKPLEPETSAIFSAWSLSFQTYEASISR